MASNRKRKGIGQTDRTRSTWSPRHRSWTHPLQRAAPPDEVEGAPRMRDDLTDGEKALEYRPRPSNVLTF